MADMIDKSAIRQAMRQRRRALPDAVRRAAAQSICARLATLIGSGRCAVYLASPDEIDLGAAIGALLSRGVELAAPRWNGSAYTLSRLCGLAARDLRPGPMGILEPRQDAPVAPASVDFWVVPGLAFARDGGRLGYGGGWYDRLLAGASPRAVKLGVAYGFQVLERLPCEAHDVRLDGIVTELVRIMRTPA